MQRTKDVYKRQLYNIHRRLRLIYGEGCGVQIYAKEGCYTKTVLLLKEGGMECEENPYRGG